MTDILSEEKTCPLSFYNIEAHIFINHRLQKENIAVRGIWQKGENCYFKVYFYDSKKTKALDTHYIYDLYDKSTEKYYKDIQAFINDYNEVMQARENRAKDEIKAARIENNFNTLQPLVPEIIVLMFFALMRPELENVKISVVVDFIKKHQAKASNFSSQYIEAFIKAQTINVAAFYSALEELPYHEEDILEDLINEAIKISATDGVIHYEEKLYLAELMQFYRDNNIRFQATM